MHIERTIYRIDMTIHYIITDNICSLCKHNPDNYCPIMGCDGSCKKSHKSVIECIDYKKYKI